MRDVFEVEDSPGAADEEGSVPNPLAASQDASRTQLVAALAALGGGGDGRDAEAAVDLLASYFDLEAGRSSSRRGSDGSRKKRDKHRPPPLRLPDDPFPPQPARDDAAAGGTSESSENWHTATLLALSSNSAEDAWLRERGPALFALALVLVAFQSISIVAVVVGTFSPSCHDNGQCGSAGSFCALHLGGGRCEMCGFASHLLGVETLDDGRTLNDPLLPTFAGYNTTQIAEFCADGDVTAGGVSWCSACVHTAPAADSGSASAVALEEATTLSVMAGNVQAMGPFDTITLIFASFVIAIAAASELVDIQLFSLMLQQAAANEVGGARSISQSWSVALAVLNGARRFLFLPTLVMAVPVLVALKGGDALSVCMNTVAVLFLTDVDEAVYAFCLKEAVRSRVAEAGRVQLSRSDDQDLWISKTVHVALIVLCVLGNVWLVLPRGDEGTGGETEGGGGSGGGHMLLLNAMFCGPFGVFVLGGVLQIEGIVHHSDKVHPQEACCQVARVLAQGLAGLLSFGALMMTASYT
jgi:hypothetical protein